MNLDWSSDDNSLLLNPRLQPATRKMYEAAWERLVTPHLKSHVGIATSGSSGAFGKLILLSKKALLTSAAAVNRRFNSNVQDVWLKKLPDFHVGGLGIHARAYLSGAKVFDGASDRWSAAQFLEECFASGATLISLVPTQLFDLAQIQAKAPAQVRAVIIGGGRLEPELYERATQLGWPLHPSYGMTECCSQIATALNPNDPRLMPLDHVEVKQAEDGRLLVKSDSLLTGQIVFEPSAQWVDPKSSSWFATEDRGGVASDGSLRIEGRLQDFVKIGGEGVVMSRLESQLEKLRAHSRFSGDAAVLAAFDERLGASVAMLATGPSDEAQQLFDQFNAAVMPFERARSLHVLAKIPRSDLGKLLRSEALLLVGLKPATDR